MPWKYFLSAPRAPRQERREKWPFPRQPFSLFFFKSFRIFWYCPDRPEFGDQMGWTSVTFFGAWTWLMAFGHFLFMSWIPWTTGLDGPWTPSKLLWCWTWSAVDRKNGPLQKSNFIWSNGIKYVVLFLMEVWLLGTLDSSMKLC